MINNTKRLFTIFTESTADDLALIALLNLFISNYFSQAFKHDHTDSIIFNLVNGVHKQAAQLI